MVYMLIANMVVYTPADIRISMRIDFHSSFEALTPHEGLQPASDQVGLVDRERCDGHVGSCGRTRGGGEQSATSSGSSSRLTYMRTASDGRHPEYRSHGLNDADGETA